MAKKHKKAPKDEIVDAVFVEAPHKTEESGKPSESQGKSEQALVQVIPSSGGSRAMTSTRPWKWTKNKRRALDLMLQGAGPTEIARAIGKHRNTILGWRKRPEWIAELRAKLAEQQATTKLRRLAVTTTLADTLARKALETINKKPGEKIDVGQASLLLREHRDYARFEREQFGEDMGGGRGPSGPAVNINIGGVAGGGEEEAEEDVVNTGAIAFADFLKEQEASASKIIVSSESPQGAVVATTRRLLQETELIDMIREEDKREMEAAAEEAEEAKQRRRR